MDKQQSSVIIITFIISLSEYIQIAFPNQEFNIIFQLHAVIGVMACILMKSVVQIFVSFFRSCS